MSSFEGNERGRAKNGAIQYASNQFNGMADNNNTAAGIKKAVATKRDIDVAYVNREEENNKRFKDNLQPPIVTGSDVRKAVEDGLYR